MSSSLLKQFEKISDFKEKLQAIEKEINNNDNVAKTIKESCPDMLHDFYNIVCDTYAQRLIEQFDLNKEESYWVSNEIGVTLAYSDYYFISMDEVVLLVDNLVSFAEFVEWYEQWTDFDSDNRINLRSWIMGARPGIFKKKRND